MKKKTSKRNSNNIKKNRLVKLVLIVSILICVGAYFLYKSNQPARYQGVTGDIHLTIKPTKKSFKKSEFVRINVEATNVSDSTFPIPWNTCGDVYKVILDRQYNIIDDEGLVCGIGGGIAPGATVKDKLLELDLSHLESGKHILSISYSKLPQKYDELNSNEIEIDLVAADPIYDCYNYAEDISTLCHQVMIRSNTDVSPEDNNKNCQHIKNKFLTKTYPEPHFIPKLSTENCNEGAPAMFVFNVPYQHSKHFDNALENAKKSDKVCKSTNYSSYWLVATRTPHSCF